MKKFTWIFLLAMLVVACGKSTDKEQTDSTQTAQDSTQTSSKKRPNIVLIVGDDQGYPYFGFMGADYVQTPNMDALAKSGTLFTDGYVPDNHCRPSLQTLMTGTLPVQYAVEVDKYMANEQGQESYKKLSNQEKRDWMKQYKFHAMKNFMTLPKMLQKEGYVSFQGGKWWEFNYQNGGFTHGMTKGWKKEDEKKKEWFQKFMGGEGTELARATMQPVYDFIDKNNDKPMFIWFAPELPHYPFDAPDKYYNIYKDKTYKGKPMTESAKRYYANCTWFDDGLGELVKYLKEKGEFENTLFVYVNDNGWEQAPNQEFRADSLRWHNGGDKGKLSIYDMSFRTPIIFSWQGKIASGVTKNDLMHSADIPATILDYLGMQVPKGYFGQSYKPVIEGKKSNLRDAIVGNVNQMRWEGDMMGKKVEGYWLRNRQWFFQWNLTTKTQALFDMQKDPNNDNNVAKQNKQVVEECIKKINEWRKQMGSM